MIDSLYMFKSGLSFYKEKNEFSIETKNQSCVFFFKAKPLYSAHDINIQENIFSFLKH